MSDLIDRQVAIDALIRKSQPVDNRDGTMTITMMTNRVIKETLENLPSAQPEIIRCKDCRWAREACGGNIECFVDLNVPSEYHGYEWYCPNGERRTDE